MIQLATRSRKSRDAEKCRTTGGDKVEAWLCGPADALVPAAVTDLKNGCYSVRFTVPRAGAWTLKPRVSAPLHPSRPNPFRAF